MQPTVIERMSQGSSDSGSMGEMVADHANFVIDGSVVSGVSRRSHVSAVTIFDCFLKPHDEIDWRAPTIRRAAQRRGSVRLRP